MSFQEILNHYRGIINKELKRFFSSLKVLESGNPLIKKHQELLGNFCLSPGKRLRPIMAIMAFKGISQKNEKEIIFPALALELYHNSTLIHDDIYDEDIIRRGMPAPHFLFQKWFEKRYKKYFYSGALYSSAAQRFAVVAGFINGQILKALANLPILQSNVSSEKKVEILKLFQRFDISDNIGQAIDLFFERENKITEKDYLKMVDCKTGELFKASIELGAVLAGSAKSQRECLRKYAENLAAAFQIKDDLLDISIGGEKGRGVGSDIKKGKKTLLLIYSLKKAEQKEKKAIKKIAGREGMAEKEIKKVINLYYRLGAVNYCEKLAGQKIKKALFWLSQIKPEVRADSQKFFEDLANFMFQRKK